MTIEQCIKPELNIRANHAIQISDWEHINQAHSLMHLERLSAGGNIRDKSPEDLSALITGGGQLWAWMEERTILSVCTLEPKAGRLPWWYINNGITHPEHRGRGISGQLVESAVNANAQTDAGFIVLYVRQDLFERLGFTEVSINELTHIDNQIADVIRKKLRPEKETHIFIKLAKSTSQRAQNMWKPQLPESGGMGLVGFENIL